MDRDDDASDGFVPDQPTSGFDLSRRDFLGAVGASTLATTAFAAEGGVFDDIGLRFRRSTDPITRETLLDIVLLQRPHARPDGPQSTFETAWRLRASAFGPRAQFILDPPSNGREQVGPWDLRIARIGYGRLTDREIRLRFAIRSLPPPADGNLEKSGAPLKRLTVGMSTNVWSSQKGATTKNTIGLFSSTPVTGLRREEIMFRDFMVEDGVAPRFEIEIPARRIETTARLMFNGAITARRNVPGNPILSFGRDLTWIVKSDGGHIAALGGRLPLASLNIAWPDRQSKGDSERVSPLFGRGTALAATGSEARRFELGGGGGPVWTVALATGEDGAPEVLLRSQPPAREGLKLTNGEVETETVLAGNWRILSIDNGPTRRIGVLPMLSGSILERIAAPASPGPQDPARRAGTVSFQGRYRVSTENGPSLRVGERTESALGPLVTVPLGEEDDGTDEDGGGSGFPERRDWPVLALWSWGSGAGRATRERPSVHFMEATLAVIHAGTGLPGADYSRLDMDPTELRVFYEAAPTGTPPLGSYIDLGAGRGQEAARLDLSRARLRTGRGHELMSLSFRFSDLALSFRDGALPEMVSAAPRCEVSTRPVAADGGLAVHDTRPVLVVEFPPQHLFEEAVFAPQPLPPPDVELGRSAVVTLADGKVDFPGEGGAGDGERILWQQDGGEITFDPDNRVHVVEVFNRLKAVGSDEGETRATTFRTVLRGAKAEADETFSTFADGAEKKLAPLPGLPKSQTIYIGPFALDADAMAVVRKTWRGDYFLGAQVLELIDRAFAGAESVLANLRADENYVRPATFEAALEQEIEIERSVPVYTLFRDFHREVMARSLYGDAEDLGDAPVAADGTAGELEFVIAAHLAEKDGLATSARRRRYEALRARFPDYLRGMGDLGGPKRGRLSGPSRLAFRVNCPDGPMEARAAALGLDEPKDAGQRLPARPLTFELKTLLTFRGMELAVTRRAEIVYDAGQLGRIGWRAGRVSDTTPAAMLRHLGFSLGQGGTVAMRLADVARSLTRPTLLQTAIEMPARLVLSPHQNAVVLTPGEVPEAVYDEIVGPGCMVLTGSPDEAETRILWSARFVTGEDGLGLDPGFRAVWSHDLRAGAVLNRFADGARARNDAGGTLAEATPPGGPLAPWHLARLATEGRGMTLAQMEAIAGEHVCAPDQPEGTRQRLARIVREFCDALLKGADMPDPALRFRSSLSARDRHEIVLGMSAFGLPVVDPRHGAATSEPEEALRLYDVLPGYASFHPKPMAVSEFSLSSLGGNLEHDSGIVPVSAAFHWRDRRPVFEATSAERWQHRISLGRDVSAEVVSKGFLFPLGIRASLVKVTERVFHVDPKRGGAVTAPLRQRMLIRVSNPDKLFPAVRMPRQGRRFPVDRITLLTTTTPDIVDPWSDQLAAGALGPSPSGRLGVGKGLVFWPRVLKTREGNIRFEMEIDGIKSNLPLIFADTLAVGDEATMRALVTYYNDPAFVPSPDLKGTLPVDPVMHLRTLVLGGADRRYAPEIVAGSTTYQTDHWTLRATGGDGLETRQPGGKGTANIYDFETGDYIFDQVRQAANQPPFYPAVEVARVHLTQSERLMGRLLGSKRVVFDARYAQHGLPPEDRAPPVEGATESGGDGRGAALSAVPEANPREVILALLDPVKLTMGRNGDQSGGVFRPDGTIAGLSRQKGAMTLQNFAPMTLGGAEDWLPDVAELFATPSEEDRAAGSGSGKTALAQSSQGAVPAAPNPQSSSDVPDIEELRALYKKLFTYESKILGLICLPDLIDLIPRFAPPAEGVPALDELKEFGEAGQEAANVIREEVIARLAAGVARVRQEWEEIDRAIAEQLTGSNGSTDRVVRVRDVFPELFAALVQLQKAVARAAGTIDSVEFAFALSACHTAGQRFLAALKRAAADPKSAIEDAVANRFGDMLAYFRAFDGGLEGMALQLLRDGLGDFDPDKFVDRLKAEVAEWIEDAVAEATAELTGLEAGLARRRDLIGLPSPDLSVDAEGLECFAALLPSSADIRIVLTSFLQAYVEATVERVFEGQTPPDPAAVLGPWLAKTELISFENDPLAVSRATFLSLLRDTIADAIEDEVSPEPLKDALLERVEALAARLEDSASPLFDADGNLRRASRAQQIRLRYLTGVIQGLAAEDAVECLAGINGGGALLRDLLQAALRYADPAHEAASAITADIRRALEAVVAPILEVLNAAARLAASIGAGSLPGVLSALDDLLGGIRQPLPFATCADIQAVWAPVATAMRVIGGTLAEARLCPPDWTGPLPQAAPDFMLAPPDAPDDLAASLCSTLLWGAVEVDRLRVLVEGTEYVEALQALKAKVNLQFVTDQIDAQLAGRNEVLHRLTGLRDRLLEGYGAVLAEAAAIEAVVRDLADASGIDICDLTELPRLQALANLPRDAELLLVRREALMRALLAILQQAVEDMEAIAALAERGHLAVPLMAGFDDWFAQFHDGKQPPDWVEAAENEIEELRDASNDIVDAAGAAARRVADAFCDVGRQAAAVVLAAHTIAEEAGAELAAIPGLLAGLPGSVRTIGERLLTAADIDALAAAVDGARGDLEEVGDAIDLLCPPQADGTAARDAAVGPLTGLGALVLGEAVPVTVFARDAAVARLVAVGRAAMAEATLLVDELRAIVDARAQLAFLKVIAPAVRTLVADGPTDSGSVFASDDGKVTLVGLYQRLLQARAEVLDAGLPAGLSITERSFLVLPDAARPAIPGTYQPAQTEDRLTKDNDQLTGDVAWLTAAGDGELTDTELAFLTEFVNEWRGGGATPVLILRQVGKLIEDLFTGRIFQYIDFARLREEFEEQLLSLVPTKVRMSYRMNMHLGEEVAAATLGIFRPGPNTALAIETVISMNLAPVVTEGAPPDVTFGSVGTLGPFDVKLVGDMFDAITLKFSSVRFETEGGGKSRFDIGYIGHEIGPQLEFLEELQKYLAPKDGSGAILNFDRAMPGVEAGYRLQLGAFAVGNLAFSNVGLEATSILPFSNRNAVFKASLSSRKSPFTITYAPFGGSGFFAIYANTDGIIGFEAAFEFGGSAVFAMGPLTGQGRLMSGVYIARFEVDGATLTDLSMTFVAEGSAAIWIFSFGASLHVKLGQVNGGAMTGEATFSFSFSMGIADYEYSITLRKSEGKGFKGQQSSAGPSRTMFAALGATDNEDLPWRNPSGAIIRNATVCQSAEWAAYQRYFDDIPPPEEYFDAPD